MTVENVWQGPSRKVTNQVENHGQQSDNKAGTKTAMGNGLDETEQENK